MMPRTELYALDVLAQLNGWNRPLEVQLRAADSQTILDLLCLVHGEDF
jgi:hypothetical protein